MGSLISQSFFCSHSRLVFPIEWHPLFSHSKMIMVSPYNYILVIYTLLLHSAFLGDQISFPLLFTSHKPFWSVVGTHGIIFVILCLNFNLHCLFKICELEYRYYSHNICDQCSLFLLSSLIFF